LETVFRLLGVDEKSDRSGSGKKFADQFQALGEQLHVDLSHAGNIGTGAVEAGDETYLDRVAAQ
jgi:hypothetical protein